MNQERVIEVIKQSIELKQQILTDEVLLNAIENVTGEIINSFNNKDKHFI